MDTDNMTVGIDFGSTYSTISRYDPVRNTVKAISLGAASSSIPSVVSLEISSGRIDCGSAAKNSIGDSWYRIFEAFKMLLVSADETMLRSRGYDDVYTPRRISGEYLKYLLELAMKHEKKKQIGSLVICVPNIWSSKEITKDGRRILREILEEDLKDCPIGDVQVVEEPEAASAFFAYNMEQSTGEAFNGHLLIIDYGGGTLDLTLTKVSSDGQGHMEICYQEDGGAGTNHPGNDGGNERCCKVRCFFSERRDAMTDSVQQSGLPEQFRIGGGQAYNAPYSQHGSNPPSADHNRNFRILRVKAGQHRFQHFRSLQFLYGKADRDRCCNTRRHRQLYIHAEQSQDNNHRGRQQSGRAQHKGAGKQFYRIQKLPFVR